MPFYAGLLTSPSSISPTPKKLFGSAQIPRPNMAGARWARAYVATVLSQS